MHDHANPPDPVRPMWRYTDAVCAIRAKQLLGWNRFDDIILKIVAEATPMAFAWEPFSSERLKGCHRASFSIEVLPATFDAFFNSPVGYRGQYACSTVIGETANRRLLNALQGVLLGAINEVSDARRAQVVTSLQARDARVWIDETGFEDQSCDRPAIIYEPWERNDPNGAGLRAPKGTVLQVKGGWLDATDTEKRDRRKDERSYAIHMKGDI